MGVEVAEVGQRMVGPVVEEVEEVESAEVGAGAVLLEAQGQPEAAAVAQQEAQAAQVQGEWAEQEESVEQEE